MFTHSAWWVFFPSPLHLFFFFYHQIYHVMLFPSLSLPESLPHGCMHGWTWPMMFQLAAAPRIVVWAIAMFRDAQREWMPLLWLLQGCRVKMCMSFPPHTSEFLNDWCTMGGRGKGHMSWALLQTMLPSRRCGQEAALPRSALCAWQLKTFNNSFAYFSFFGTSVSSKNLCFISAWHK